MSGGIGHVGQQHSLGLRRCFRPSSRQNGNTPPTPRRDPPSGALHRIGIMQLLSGLISLSLISLISINKQLENSTPKQDHKLKHMAELQLSVVSESESRRQIGAQIAAWEENLERLHCEQFRLRCYMASLQHGELPNPKVNSDDLDDKDQLLYYANRNCSENVKWLLPSKVGVPSIQSSIGWIWIYK